MADDDDSLSSLSSLSSPPSFFDSRASSPLSVLSRSPSPCSPTSPCPPRAFDYPSPSATNVTESRSSSRTRDMDDAEGPAIKKRRLFGPEQRATQYLDLSTIDQRSGAEGAADKVQLDRLMKALRTKRKIVVIAGAGISVSAGIPDFRSATGLFTTLRSEHKLKASGKHLFDASVYHSDDSTTSFHQMVRELSQLTRNATPTPFHHMLATLAEEGRLLRLYSQNVDGIDTSLRPLATNVPLNVKGPWPKTIQLHGGLEKMQCTKCGKLSDFDGALFDGPEPPACRECAFTESMRTIDGLRSRGIGKLRPRMVLYNEFNPDEEAIGAVSAADLRARPDAVIVVGTTLKVPGVRRIAAEMCKVVRGRKDGLTAWINQSPEPLGIDLKDCWDLVIKGPCDDVALYAGLPKWDDKDIGTYDETNVEAVMEKIAKNGYRVEVPGAGLVSRDIKRMRELPPTPSVSPKHQSPAPSMDVKPIIIKLNLTRKTLNETETLAHNTTTLPPAVGHVSTELPTKLSKMLPKSAVKKQKPAARTTKAKSKNSRAKIPEGQKRLAFDVTKRGGNACAKAGKIEIGESPPPSDTSRVALPPPSYEPRPQGIMNNRTHSSTSSPMEKSSPMQPIPTDSSRHNIDPAAQRQIEYAKSGGREFGNIEDYFKSQREETISPKVIPKNMAHLLD